MKGKVWIFFILLIVGFVALLTPIITFTKFYICHWFPKNSTEVENALISFGSGVITSGIVAFWLDTSNERILSINNKRNKMLVFSPLLLLLGKHIQLFQDKKFVQFVLNEHAMKSKTQTKDVPALELVCFNCNMLMQISIPLLSNQDITQIQKLQGLANDIKLLCENRLQGLQSWGDAINDRLLDPSEKVIEECKSNALLKDVFTEQILEDLSSFSKYISQYRDLINSINKECLTWKQI